MITLLSSVMLFALAADVTLFFFVASIIGFGRWSGGGTLTPGAGGITLFMAIRGVCKPVLLKADVV